LSPEVQAALKKLVFEVIVNLALKQLFLALPFLAIPGLSQIVTFLLSKVAWLIYDQLEQSAEFVLIDFKTNKEKEQYQKAVDELKKALEGQNAEQTDQAKAEFKKRLHDLIKFGSYSK